MGRRCFWLIVVLAWTVSLTGAERVTYESITVAAASIGITAAITNPPNEAQMTACSVRLETAEIRFRFDGPAPTATEGTALEVLDILTISNNADARRIRFIRTGATSGTLKVHCFR